MVFVSGVCGLFVVAFLFFRFRFFSHLHFSRTSIFSHTPHFALTPTPPTPHSRESGNLPVMPAKGGGFAPSALDREIPAFAGMGRGFCWFLCRVFADSLLSRFCFFASVFFTLPFFSHFHFFLTLSISPSPPFSPTHPHSRESGNLPVMPAKGGGFAPLALDREIPAFAGMGRGFCWFLCRVFADSLLSRFCFFASVFFHTSIFLALPFFSHTPHFALTPIPSLTPIPAKAGISL